MNDHIMNKSKRWMHLNARPLDLERFRYHFENGSKEAVIEALEAYQNEDGGFGHGLEADCFNPNSAPIQTWVATEILWEIKMIEPDCSIVKGILKYLASGADFDGITWSNTVPSNNQYPRAYWWTHNPQENQQENYNPTVALAGFGLMCSKKTDEFYQKCANLVTSAIEALLHTDTCDEMHTLACFVRMTEYCRYANITDLYDIEYIEQVLREKILACITQDTSTWSTGYVCKPSQFIRSKESVYYETLKEIAEFECGFIKESQQEDGTWSINWEWLGYEEEFHIAKNWWRADVIIKNLLYLNAIENS